MTGWFDLRSLLDYGPKTNSSLSHILCRQFLNAFTDVTHTTSLSSLFHQLIIRSEKKWCRRSVSILFFFHFHLWPRVILAQSISENVSSVTDEYPWVILKTSIRSARTRRSSSDHSFNSVGNLSHMMSCLFEIYNARQFWDINPFISFIFPWSRSSSLTRSTEPWVSRPGWISLQ